MTRSRKKSKQIEALRHSGAARKNIPTAEYESVMGREQRSPVEVAYERRNRDLDPQLVWRGKDMQDMADLVAQAPPLFIQDKVHPKALIDDLARRSRETEAEEPGAQADIFGDFNGLPDDAARTEFYRHDANWSNRMILGDSLQVMASLAEREGLRGQVQCIYIDPPYGIKFNSNFQWSTISRDVKDGKAGHITREPEQVKAFRDTWRDGIHSYLSYLRDRLTVARDLLTESGSVFVQIGDENVHRVRAVMDEVFGEENFVREVVVRKTSPLAFGELPRVFDSVLWYARKRDTVKYHQLHLAKSPDISGYVAHSGESASENLDPLIEKQPAAYSDLKSSGYTPSCTYGFTFRGRSVPEQRKSWRTHKEGMQRAIVASRLHETRHVPRYLQLFSDFPFRKLDNLWSDTGAATQSIYVVQTQPKVIQRCVLMTTDPGDLVLDPTCGSGTTAYVAEQWGRRWITIDTSRVALALARARIMGARYPWYLLADSREGQIKEAQLSQREPSQAATCGDIRQGFVYQRVPHITLKAIANNAEIDVIYQRLQPAVEEALGGLNRELQTTPPPQFLVSSGGRKGQTINFSASAGQTVTLPSGEPAPANALLEWEVPRQPPDQWSEAAKQALERFWQARIARQRAIDESIAAKADYEYLYDKPHENRKTVRVAGPFTVESLSPHRELGFGENDELIGGVRDAEDVYGSPTDFAAMILEHLKTAGVQQAHKEDRIRFTSLAPWPGRLICAEGRYAENGSRNHGRAAENPETGRVESGRAQGASADGRKPVHGQANQARAASQQNGSPSESIEKRAGVFIGPEFGSVSRADLAAAAREAAEANFDSLIACAFNYEAHASEFEQLGRIPVLKARMNADLHMAGDLKNTGKGNLFVIFGEPDIDILDADEGMIRVKVNGVDVFHPQSGEVRSDGPEGIACWFIDTDYNEESFFVRHAYFLGANDPYKSLKTTLKAEINREAWDTLNSDTSRPFPKPETGRIAVKVINHLGDEAIKVFRV